jgi:transposase
VSLHYRSKRAQTRHFWVNTFPKLTVLCHIQSYLWLSAQVSRGPSNDSPDFAPTVMDAATRVALDQVLADAAYDSEFHHELCRELLGIRSLVVPINMRRTRKWPRGRYRRSLKRRFPCRVYRSRVHVESSFSQDKRQLGSALRGRSDEARAQEILLRVLVHNLMILKRTDQAFYRAPLCLCGQ